MDIRNKSEEFLNHLYFKTRIDLSLGLMVDYLGEEIGVNETELRNIVVYLEQKNLVQTNSNGYTKLTGIGIDRVLESRENKKYLLLRFEACLYLQSSRDAIEYLFDYVIGEDEKNLDRKQIKVSISGSLALQWGFSIWSSNSDYDYKELIRIFILLAKDKIQEKIKEGTLLDFEEIMFLTSSQIKKPTNTKSINDSDPIEFEIEIESHAIMLKEEIAENKLAAAIIETRDIINSIFYNLHSARILMLDEERNLLDFFKSANSEEEYSHRIASLGQVARSLNIIILRKLTTETDTQIGSIQLLQKYFTLKNISIQEITPCLKHIGRIRQGYPIHSDITNVLDSYRYFGLTYPVENYELTWRILLEKYLAALKEFKKLLEDMYFEKSSR